MSYRYDGIFVKIVFAFVFTLENTAVGFICQICANAFTFKDTAFDFVFTLDGTHLIVVCIFLNSLLW